MQKIKILSSGSIGNCLAICDSSGKFILVDVGLPHKVILKALNYDLKDCCFVLASHDHFGDHTKSLDYFIKLGIPCYGNQDICDHHKGCNLLPKVLNIDGFTIQNFDLVHNVPNNAFVIDTDDNIRILYCTDTQYIPQKVKGVNYAIIEANFDDEEMLDNLLNDEVSRSQYQNHHSLSNCIEYLQQIYSADLQGVILWHLSNTNINANKAVETVKKALGFNNVVYAKQGLVMALEKEEF